jgi:hypothetical protein
MTDAAATGLRAISDELLAELDQLAAIETEKRDLQPGDERAVELSAEARRLAQRILATSRAEEILAEGAQKAVEEGLPGAPTTSISETHRPLFQILDDWRQAERDVIAEQGTAANLEARKRSLRLREEFQRASESTLRDEGSS